MKLTRRQLAATLAVAAPLAAQQEAPAPPEDLDTAARNRVRSTAAALNAVTVPMAVEPAFSFQVK